LWLGDRDAQCSGERKAKRGQRTFPARTVSSRRVSNGNVL
jgi:hypothetical protein